MIVRFPYRSRADETEMAEHAATLPPPPRDDDADEAEFTALLGALQGTARGRRFLEEFARRQRNADTVMVLDAVARIEARLAAQQAEPPPGAPTAAVDELVRIIDEGRAALAQAAEALAAVDALKAQFDTAGGPAAADTGAAPAPEPVHAPEPTRAAPPPPADVPPADVPAPEAAMIEPLPAAVLPTPAPAVMPPADEPPEEEAAVSLGQALLTEGMVTLPAPPAADALAALRRMTQADKLAFFS